MKHLYGSLAVIILMDAVAAAASGEPAPGLSIRLTPATGFTVAGSEKAGQMERTVIADAA